MPDTKTYTALRRIDHDGVVYGPEEEAGAALELTAPQAAALLARGALAEETVDLARLSKSELLAYAKSKGIAVSADLSKADLVAAITTALAESQG